MVSWTTIVVHSRDDQEVGVANKLKSPKNQPQFSQTTMGWYWCKTKPKQAFMKILIFLIYYIVYWIFLQINWLTDDPMHGDTWHSTSYSSLSAMFNSLHSSVNQHLLEKLLCNQGSHYERYRRFLLSKGSHHVKPPNQCFSRSAQINGTQERTLVSPWRMHCKYCDVPEGTSWAEAMLDSEKIHPIALAVIEYA